MIKVTKNVMFQIFIITYIARKLLLIIFSKIVVEG